MPPSCLWLPRWCFFMPMHRKYALHLKAHLKYWRCWGIINPTAPVLTQEVYFSVDCFQRVELFCKGLLDLTLLWAHLKILKKSRNWRQKWSFIPVFPFFFVFCSLNPLSTPVHLLWRGQSIHRLHACSSSSVWGRPEKKRSWVGLRVINRMEKKVSA